MKAYKIPILNDEYRVVVYVGKKEDCEKRARTYLRDGNIEFYGRGHTYFNKVDYPVIVVDGDLPAHIAIATLAHEASHAVQFIEEYTGITDTSGELRGHCIGAIMRAVCKDLIPKKKK